MAIPFSIATVGSSDSAIVQGLFVDAITRWQAKGFRVAGVIEETRDVEGQTCNAGVLRDVTSGRSHSIFRSVPQAGTSCRIDAEGACGACAELLPQICTCDLVVLSKFGKLEAGQEGLFGAFLAAFEAGKPILTTVSKRYLTHWNGFAPDAVTLAPTGAAIDAWWLSLSGAAP